MEIALQPEADFIHDKHALHPTHHEAREMLNIEKRKIERFEMKLPAIVQATGKEITDAPLQLFTRDVSSEGAFFAADPPLPEGTPVNVEMTLVVGKSSRAYAQRSLIHVRGMVVRTAPDGMAVRFERGYRIQAAD